MHGVRAAAVLGLAVVGAWVLSACVPDAPAGPTGATTTAPVTTTSTIPGTTVPPGGGADCIGFTPGSLLIMANLGGARLDGCDLSGTNLTGADMVNTSLVGANLSGADLRGADLTGANLTGANLAGASLASRTIVISPNPASPGDPLTVAGSGWEPGQAVGVQLVQGCSVAADANGDLAASGACRVAGAPFGTYLMRASSLAAPPTAATNGTFRIVPAARISPAAARVTPTSITQVGGVGFAASSTVTVRLDGTIVGSGTSDPGGSVGPISVTVPADAPAGWRDVTIADAGGHAASTQVEVFRPTLVRSKGTGVRGELFTITGAGWPSAVGLNVRIGGQVACQFATSAEGTIDRSCAVPLLASGTVTSDVVGLSSPLFLSLPPFTVVPSLTVPANERNTTPGALTTVTGTGFAPSAPLTFRFDGVAVATPVGLAADAAGDFASELTIPASATVGTHLLTVSDGTSISAPVSVRVYRPQITTTPAGAAAPGTSLLVGVTGWIPGARLGISIGNGYLCEPVTNANGAVAAMCTMPPVPFGPTELSAVSEFDPDVVFSAPFSVVAGLTVTADQSAVSPGATVMIGTGGFAAGSTLTFRVNGSVVATSPAVATTGATGTAGTIAVTIPGGLAAGTLTLTGTDGAGHVATLVVPVYTPTLAPSVSTGPVGSTFGVTGAGWVPGDRVTVRVGGQTSCLLLANSSGSISGPCTVPQVPSGVTTLTASGFGRPVVAAEPQTFTVT